MLKFTVKVKVKGQVVKIKFLPVQIYNPVFVYEIRWTWSRLIRRIEIQLLQKQKGGNNYGYIKELEK